MAQPALCQNRTSALVQPAANVRTSFAARGSRQIRCSAAQAPLPPPSTATATRTAAGELGVVTRAQLLKGGLVAAGGLLLGPVVPPAQAAEAAAALDTGAAGAAAAAIAASSAQSISQVVLNTLADCQLAVSIYPTFSYNAAGGGGGGTVERLPSGLLRVVFDTASLDIPPINYQHAAILGIPVPPPLNIAIVPQRLEGTVDPETGRCELDFLASFEFTAGALYRAAPLTVATTLTTEASDGVLLHGQGQRLKADGRARLVGVARVPRTNDALLNTFLQLPTDALAVLSAEMRFD